MKLFEKKSKKVNEAHPKISKIEQNMSVFIVVVGGFATLIHYWNTKNISESISILFITLLLSIFINFICKKRHISVDCEEERVNYRFLSCFISSLLSNICLKESLKRAADFCSYDVVRDKVDSVIKGSENEENQWDILTSGNDEIDSELKRLFKIVLKKDNVDDEKIMMFAKTYQHYKEKNLRKRGCFFANFDYIIIFLCGCYLVFFMYEAIMYI